jgi:periplasmic protein CpxP/Spy
MSLRSRVWCGGWRGALSGLLLLALAAPGALPARVEAAPQVAGEASPAAAHRRVRRPGLDQRVALLTRALELDARQQAALRTVLTDQREQAQRIWRDESLPSANRIGLTKALSRHTADRIRALLTPEQRKKYDPPPQGGPAQAVANAHVEDWMQGAKGR